MNLVRRTNCPRSMSFSVVLPIVVAIVCLGTADASRFLRPALRPNGRIVGGVDISIEDVPWQASLQVHGFGYCGASIVSEEWVLTAAHCASYPVSYITVKAGSSLKNQGGTIHPAITVIQHEGYRTNQYGIPENDVALIRVGTPFILDPSRKPVLLFNDQEEALEGSLGVITGWGAVYEGGTASEILQTVSVPVVSKSSCNKAYRSYGGIPEGQICAAHPDGAKDACQGDSGGPLTIGGRLAGIVSWGNGCARPGYPGVYTEVAAYRNWISQNASI